MFFFAACEKESLENNRAEIIYIVSDTYSTVEGSGNDISVKVALDKGVSRKEMTIGFLVEASDNAKEDEAYEILGGKEELSFPVGVDEAELIIHPIDNSVEDGDKTITVSIISVSDKSLKIADDDLLDYSSVAELTIFDDDCPFLFDDFQGEAIGNEMYTAFDFEATASFVMSSANSEVATYSVDEFQRPLMDYLHNEYGGEVTKYYLVNITLDYSKPLSPKVYLQGTGPNNENVLGNMVYETFDGNNAWEYFVMQTPEDIEASYFRSCDTSIHLYYTMYVLENGKEIYGPRECRMDVEFDQ